MISIKAPKGDWEIEKFFKKAEKGSYNGQFNAYGQMGVDALSVATPVNTGLLASSWGYKVTNTPGQVEIAWTNSDVEGGVPIAILVQYGHGRQNGGIVKGIDYINPALKPVFDEIIEKVWKEVK